MSAPRPLNILGPALVEAIRQVVREELEAIRDAGPGPVELLTPAEASAALGGRPSASTIVAWVKAGRLPLRTNNVSDNPKRPNFLVVLDDVRAAMNPTGGREPEPKPTAIDEARARARLKASTL